MTGASARAAELGGVDTASVGMTHIGNSPDINRLFKPLTVGGCSPCFTFTRFRRSFGLAFDRTWDFAMLCRFG